MLYKIAAHHYLKALLVVKMGCLLLLFLTVTACSTHLQQLDSAVLNAKASAVIPQAYTLTRANQRIVIIGTFHSNNVDVIDIAKRLVPEVVNAQALFVEVDKRDLKKGTLGDFYFKPGGRLSKELSPASYAYYNSKLSGKVSGSIERLRPMTVYILSVLPDESLSENGTVMDDYLMDKAINEGVVTVGLESFEEQFTSLYALNEAATIQILELQATDEQETLEQADLIQEAYLEGDLLTVYQSSNAIPEGLSANNAKAVQAYLEHLIEGRNSTMWQRVQHRVEEDKLTNVVVAVGAAHLLGGNGIIELAIKAGYTVEAYTTQRLN